MLETRADIDHPVASTAARIVLPVLALLLAMIGLGLLLTSLLGDENGVNRSLAAHPSGAADAVSGFFSMVGSTPVIIGVTAVTAVILRLTLRRWAEPLFLCAAVSAQAIIFFFTTLVIDRQRPAVRHLDASPPTSSFPSGHTSAAVALYCGLALILATLARRTWLKTLAWLLVLVPVSVAVSRLYRGMHHPSDVLASFLNGSLCVAIMWSAIVNRSARTSAS
jgi:undecaprenyl-diphosphatase